MNSEPKVRITLVANSGFLIEYCGEKILIDALYTGEGHPFSAIPDDTERKIFDSAPPFDNVDYLMFTHCHIDHFSPQMTKRYLQRNRVKGIFLPGADEEEQKELTQYIIDNNIGCLPLSKTMGANALKLSDNLLVRIIPTGHLDRKFAGVPHFCYLINIGGRNLLFTGDADYINDKFDSLAETELDAVFINPLFFNALARERFFKGKLNSRCFCVCHTPFENEDNGLSSRTIARDMDYWRQEKGKVVVFNEKDQSIEI